MTFTFNYRRGNQPETEFKEFEPGLDLAQLPTAGSATQFKFFKFGLGMRIGLDCWNRS